MCKTSPKLTVRALEQLCLLYKMKHGSGVISFDFELVISRWLGIRLLSIAMFSRYALLVSVFFGSLLWDSFEEVLEILVTSILKRFLFIIMIFFRTTFFNDFRKIRKGQLEWLRDNFTHTQLAVTCSKLTKETITNGVVLMSLLLSSNIFYTLLQCFYC